MQKLFFFFYLPSRWTLESFRIYFRQKKDRREGNKKNANIYIYTYIKKNFNYIQVKLNFIWVGQIFFFFYNFFFLQKSILDFSFVYTAMYDLIMVFFFFLLYTVLSFTFFFSIIFSSFFSNYKQTIHKKNQIKLVKQSKKKSQKKKKK